MDWKKIKAEYIAGGTSYRKLAEKYEVSFTTLQRKAKEERWLELRRQKEEKTMTKIVDFVSSREAKKANRIIDVADKLLCRIANIIDSSEPDTSEVKQLASALKDLKEIKGFKSDADMREQEARIAKLQRETEKGGNDDSALCITVSGLPEEFKV